MVVWSNPENKSSNNGLLQLKMTQFSLEKILTVSAEEYAETQQNKTLEDYEFRGVNVKSRNNPNENLHELFLSHVPSSAEVVVDYKFNSEYASGTALIPKQKEK